jgi:hypothetical protein
MGSVDWLVGKDWADTLEWLPGNLDAMLDESGVLQRRRAVRCGEELVRLGLAYSLLDLSLRSTAAWWTSIGQPSMSDVAVLKRLKSATPFLEKVVYAMLSRATPGPRLADAGLRVRLIAKERTGACTSATTRPGRPSTMSKSPMSTAVSIWNELPPRQGN